MAKGIEPLDLVGKLQQASIASRAATVSAGAPGGSPIIVDLDPTTFCDLVCPECISSSVLNGTRFGRDRLLSLCEELADSGVRGVIFIGGGEPLVHRSTPDAIRVLCDRGVAVALVTNGTHLTRLPAETLARMSWIRVSVDAGCQATFDVVRPSRGRSAFELVIANMRYAREHCPSLGYSFVVMHRDSDADDMPFTNIGDLPLAADLARDLGCDYLEVKAQLRADLFIDEGLVPHLAELREALAAADMRRSEDFVVVRSSSIRALLSGRLGEQRKRYSWCPTTHLRTLVTPTGMFACGYHRGNPAFRLGQVATNSFSDAWGAAPLTTVDPRRDCRFHCARHEINQVCADPDAQRRITRAPLADSDIFF